MKIIEKNIQSGAESQFWKQTGSYTFDVPYDGKSVMHYGSTAFGIKVGGVTQTTIEPLVCKNLFLIHISNIIVSWSSGFFPLFFMTEKQAKC